MKTDEQRGRFGRWIKRGREERGWSTQPVARAEIERRTGLRLAHSVYAELESGRTQPTQVQLVALEKVFGPAPADHDSEGAVLAAIAALSSRVEELLAPLATEQGRQARSLEKVQGVLDGLVPPAIQGAARQRAPRG